MATSTRSTARTKINSGQVVEEKQAKSEPGVGMEDDTENLEEEEENDNPDENYREEENDNHKNKIANSQIEKDALAKNKGLAEINIDKLTIDEILLLKVTLDDGTNNFLFSRGPKYSEEYWPINCHLCRLGNLFTDEHLRHHLKGKSHLFKLNKRPPLAKFYSEPFYQSLPKDLDKEKPIKIYPGEIIEDLTDEYKDRIIDKEEFQVKLPDDKKLVKQLEKEHMHEYNTKLPLIGLCYIYKMMGFQGVTYFCTLCNLKIKEEAFQHIVSSDHQFKYINRHFPKLYEQVYSELKPIRGIDVRFCIRNVFRKLYRKIENIKGYRKVTICDDNDFFKNRKKFLLKTRFDEHYDENTIMITQQEVDVLIRKCVNGMQFIKPDYISLENQHLGLRLTYQDELNGAQIRNDMGLNNFGGDSGGFENNIWNNYHQVMGGEIDDLNREYRTYDRFPRRHPKYEGELNKYNIFKMEANEKDKKEFNMPWNTYWKRRLRVLYENDLTKRKQRIKKEFGLRTNMRTPSPSNYYGGGGGSGWNNQRNMNQQMLGNNYGNFGGRGVGYQGYGNDCGRGYNNSNDYYDNNQQAAVGLMMAMMQNASGGMRGGGGGDNMGISGGRSHPPNSQVNLPSTQELPLVSNEPLGVISVLRLFNALENQLGSLGPQAVQLLSRAVLVEKNNQNPNDLMMEKEFYIFFATAREKLKGQYFANMIDSNIIVAVKKTIQDATILMEMFEDYCKRTGKSLPNIETGVENTNENAGSTNRGGFNSGMNSSNWKSGGNNKNSGGNDDNNRPFANDDFFIGGSGGGYSTGDKVNPNDYIGNNNRNCNVGGYQHGNNNQRPSGSFSGNNGGYSVNKNVGFSGNSMSYGSNTIGAFNRSQHSLSGLRGRNNLY